MSGGHIPWVNFSLQHTLSNPERFFILRSPAQPLRHNSRSRVQVVIGWLNNQLIPYREVALALRDERDNLDVLQNGRNCLR